jgi:hypothetical protein
MIRKIIAVAFIAIAPLAFGQTNASQAGSSRSSKGSTTETAATTTQEVASVNALIPGRSITVSASSLTQPLSYVLANTVSYVDSTGKQVDPSEIRPGTRVRLDFKGTGKERTVDRIVVINPE